MVVVMVVVVIGIVMVVNHDDDDNSHRARDIHHDHAHIHRILLRIRHIQGIRHSRQIHRILQICKSMFFQLTVLHNVEDLNYFLP